MREILFRGKRSDNGEWIEGMLLKCTMAAGTAYLIFADSFATDLLGNVHALDHAMVDPETVGQFTGLLDKNGRKIFEGDIVCMNTGEDECSISVYARVQLLPNGPCLRDRETDCFVSFDCVNFSRNAPRFWEVIGNIHDNPELLGGDGCGD